MSASDCLRKCRYLVYMVLILTQIPAAMAESESDVIQSVIHALDYVAVDYPGVISNGKVVNDSEYAEQKEVAEHALSLTNRLSDNQTKSDIVTRAQVIQQAVNNKVEGKHVAMLSHALIATLIDVYQVDTSPKFTPSLKAGQQLYQTHCVACHGPDGLGNGPLSVEMKPPPVNFHDKDRQQHRSVFTLYNTITLGVGETAMPSFSQLNGMQRWALALFVSNYFATDEERQQGKSLWAAQTGSKAIINDLQQLTKQTPNDVALLYGQDAVALQSYLRANPQLLSQQQPQPLENSRGYLDASLQAYRSQDYQMSYEFALSAYLDGFELVETQLDALAPQLRQQIEIQMVEYRSLVNDRADPQQIKTAHDSLLYLLELAEGKLTDANATASVSFFTAFVILLREGLEAILVLAAIIAVLTKSGQRHAIPYVHAGWIGALLLGALTWYAAEEFITISGAGRELTEGVSALLAAGMLFYVGFWLHNQTNAKHWKNYIRSKITNAVSNSAKWGLALVAFLAVYREVFESVLFYQSMWLNTQPSGHSYILAGIISASAVLFLLAWLILRYSVRLPLKPFFRVNMVLMFGLAVIFAGKGVVAMQEAGKFPINLVSFPQIDMLGIYPNLQSLGLQLTLISLVATWCVYSYIKSNRHHTVAGQ